MNQMQTLERFMADRDAALLSLDKEKIVSYCHRWGVRFPNSNSEKVFWAEVHKARICLAYFPEDERELSRSWLQNNGLVAAGTIPDDSQKYIAKITHGFGVDRENSRVVVEIEEATL